MWDGYMKTYPNVPYISASLIQGITLGVSNIDLFAFQSTYPGSLDNRSAQPVAHSASSTSRFCRSWATSTFLPASLRRSKESMQRPLWGIRALKPRCSS